MNNPNTFEEQIRYWNDVDDGYVGPRSVEDMRAAFLELFGGTPPPEPLLDFGCGTGRIYAALNAPEHYLGADISRRYLDVFEEHQPNAKTVLLITDGKYGEFLDDEFGTVIAYSVFTHLTPDQWPKYLAEIHRIIRPDGWFAVSIFNMREIPVPKYNWAVIDKDEFYEKAAEIGFEKVREMFVKENADGSQTLILFRKVKK